jgi:uncharacterized membrane protein YcaP (DUF421 family)
MEKILSAVFRVVFIYIYVLIAVRLAGKRAASEATPLDFVTALILGDMFDGGFFGEIPVAKAAACFVTVVGLHITIRYMVYRHALAYRLFFSPTVTVIENGQWVEEGLRQERLPRNEILSLLRIKGFDRLSMVKKGSVEPTDHLSVLRERANQLAQKDDLAGEPR